MDFVICGSGKGPIKMYKWIFLIFAMESISVAASPWTEHAKFLLAARTTKAAFDQAYSLPEIVEVHWGLTQAGKKGVVLIRKKEQNPNCESLGWRTEGFWAIFESDSQIGMTGSGIVECDGDTPNFRSEGRTQDTSF